MIDYTKNQKKAINHDQGNLQIIACAGSGKTDTVSRRIATLIANGVHPRGIIAFTFTEKAAEELKLRIRKYVNEMSPECKTIGELFVGTHHAFCFKILKKYIPFYNNFNALDEGKQTAFLARDDIYNQINLWRFKKLNGKSYNKFYAINVFRKSVDIIRNDMIDIDSINDDMKKCYIEYEKLLVENKYLDFSSMNYKAVQLLKNNPDILKKVQEEVKYLTVDEYQDINKVQEKLINLISKKANICVVGDDDQTIYQWRGTNAENILTFKQRYSNVEEVNLDDNFRCSNGIISIANKLIRKNWERLDKKMCFPEKSKNQYQKGDIIHKWFDYEDDEVDFIVQDIKKKIGITYTDSKGKKRSVDYRDIAILFRSVKSSSKKLIKACKKAGIPIVAEGTKNLFDFDEVKLAIESLEYVFYGGNIFKLTNSFSSVFPENSQEEFLKKIKSIKNEFCQKKNILALQKTFHKILSSFGAQNANFKEQHHYNFGKISQMISDFEVVYPLLLKKDFKNFLDFTHGYAEKSYDEGGLDSPINENVVKILTVHKAKGLEFSVVYVPYLVTQRFPYLGGAPHTFLDKTLYDVMRYKGSFEDERRLFYVSITRSEKFLILSGSRNIEGLKQAKSKSKFIDNLDHDYIESEDCTERKKEFIPVKVKKPIITTQGELRYFKDCPYQFKLRFLFGYNPGVPAAFSFGKQIHHIINLLHKENKNKIPNKSDILNIMDKNFFMRYAHGEVFERMKKKATELILFYVSENKDLFFEKIETEKSFEFMLENEMIIGAIDMLRSSKNNKKQIIDIKTDKIVDYEKYEFQVRLYTIASMKTLDFIPDEAFIYDLQNNHKHTVDISKPKLDTTIEEVKTYLNEIRELNFPSCTDKKNCMTCDMKYMCNQKSFIASATG